MKKKRTDTNFDLLLGSRIMEERLACGWSRVHLASRIGMTHQQLHKYEKGTNRITVRMMINIAGALGRKVAYFLEGAEKDEETPTQHRRMSMEVSRNFLRIRNPEHQTAVNTLVRTLAEGK